MRTKNKNSKLLMCKKCGLMVKSDDPVVKVGENQQPDDSSNGDGVEQQSEDQEEWMEDENGSGMPFKWSAEIDETKPRPMPPISDEHRSRIEQFRENGIITNPKIFDVIMSLDFAIFYDKITDEWIEHNYILLDRSSEVVKEGDHVLVLTYNTYYSVALSLLLGPKGAVMCYGHIQNSYSLKKHGLGWLMEDHRVMFRNPDDSLYYAIPFRDFQDIGWPRMAPYNVIMMSDNDLTDAVIDQLSDEAVVFRPETGDILYRNHAGM